MSAGEGGEWEGYSALGRYVNFRGFILNWIDDEQL